MGTLHVEPTHAWLAGGLPTEQGAYSSQPPRAPTSSRAREVRGSRPSACLAAERGRRSVGPCGQLTGTFESTLISTPARQTFRHPPPKQLHATGAVTADEGRPERASLLARLGGAPQPRQRGLFGEVGHLGHDLLEGS